VETRKCMFVDGLSKVQNLLAEISTRRLSIHYLLRVTRSDEYLRCVNNKQVHSEKQPFILVANQLSNVKSKCTRINFKLFTRKISTRSGGLNIQF
jgi:hypothetical protein